MFINDKCCTTNIGNVMNLFTFGQAVHHLDNGTLTITIHQQVGL